jgi:Fic family protein
MVLDYKRRKTVAVEMTEFEEKVWDYLRTHKTPVQAKTLAKLWIISDNKVARAMNRFVENGIADLVRIGSKKFYRVKE